MVLGYAIGNGIHYLMQDDPSVVYEKGVEKLLTESPSEAIDYLLDADIKKPHELYLVAYNYYLAGEHKRANDLMTVILTLEISPKLEGACYYLLGLIERAKGNVNLELSHLVRSAKLGSGRNKWLSTMELAYTHLTIKDYDKCLAVMNEAYGPISELPKAENDLFRWHQIMTRYHLHMDDPESAL